MSDFTFTVENAGPDRIGQWSRAVTPGPAFGSAETPQVPDQRERPRARRSESTLGFRNLFDGPPAGANPRERSWETMPADNAPSTVVASSVGRSRPTARHEQRPEDEQRVRFTQQSEPPLQPQPPERDVPRRRRAPTPSPQLTDREVQRDAAAIQRRGYVASEAGVTDIDDPVPSYHSNAPSMAGALPAPRLERQAALFRDTGASGEDNIRPDDSVSSTGRSRRSRSSRTREDSVSGRSSASSISLSDSSVERIVKKLADTGVGGAASRRTTLDVVPEEVATSAKNRVKHSLRHQSYTPQIAFKGAGLMVGAQRVYRDDRGNLVLLKHRR